LSNYYCLTGGHKIACDYESMAYRLADIGFVDIKQMEWSRNDLVPSQPVLEGMDSERMVESLVIECSKPISA